MLRFIVFLLFSFFPIRFYSDNSDLVDGENNNNDTVEKRELKTNDKSDEGVSSKTQKGNPEVEDDNDEGFYGAAYRNFKERYNTILSPAEEKYLKIGKEDHYTIRGIKQTTLREILEGSNWRQYKRKFYSSESYFLYRPVYDLYAPHDVLFYSSFNYNFDYEVGTESGYRRFDFLSRNVFDIPINDTKTPMVMISSAIDPWIGIRSGFISSFEYSFSFNKNIHLGFVWDIVPLHRYYDRIFFFQLKEDGTEDTKKSAYDNNLRYLFFPPFYSYVLYKDDDERFISYLNVSYKSFNVNESGGSNFGNKMHVEANKYFYNSCRFDKYDTVKSKKSSPSFFYFLQYRTIWDWRVYFHFEFLREDNEVEVFKEEEIVVPPSIRGKKNDGKNKEGDNFVPTQDEEKYFYINEGTIIELGLGNNIDQLRKKIRYYSFFKFSKATFDLGVENIPFLFFHFDFFIKISKCDIVAEKSVDSKKEKAPIKPSYEPTVGLVIHGPVKVRAEILFDGFYKDDIYFKCIFEGKNSWTRSLKFMILLKKKTAFDILHPENTEHNILNFHGQPSEHVVPNLAEKEIVLLFHLLTRRINIADRISFVLFPRIFVIFNSLFYSRKLKENNKIIKEEIAKDDKCIKEKFRIKVDDKKGKEKKEGKQEEYFTTLKNRYPLLILNPSFKFKIRIMKNIFFSSLFFITKKFSIHAKNFVIDYNNFAVERCDNLPLCSCIFKLYYKRRMKGDAHSFLSYGLRVKYDTFYYPDEFNILTQRWYNCSKKMNFEEGYILPVIDLFLNLRIGWLDISLECTDLIQAFTEYTSILSPYYLRRPWSPFNFIISFITLD